MTNLETWMQLSFVQALERGLVGAGVAICLTQAWPQPAMAQTSGLSSGRSVAAVDVPEYFSKETFINPTVQGYGVSVNDIAEFQYIKPVPEPGDYDAFDLPLLTEYGAANLPRAARQFCRYKSYLDASEAAWAAADGPGDKLYVTFYETSAFNGIAANDENEILFAGLNLASHVFTSVTCIGKLAPIPEPDIKIYGKPTAWTTGKSPEGWVRVDGYDMLTGVTIPPSNTIGQRAISSKNVEIERGAGKFCYAKHAPFVGQEGDAASNTGGEALGYTGMAVTHDFIWQQADDIEEGKKMPSYYNRYMNALWGDDYYSKPYANPRRLNPYSLVTASEMLQLIDKGYSWYLMTSVTCYKPKEMPAPQLVDAADAPTVTFVNSADYSNRSTKGSIMTAYGQFPFVQAQSFGIDPLTGSMPTQVDGISIELDDNKTGRGAAKGEIFYVSETQINFMVPTGDFFHSTGLIDVSVVKDGARIGQGAINLEESAFALYASSDGFPAAHVISNNVNDGQQLLLEKDKPVALDDTYLILYGTGLNTARDENANARVSATVNGVVSQVVYAGRSGSNPGLDQINIVLPNLDCDADGKKVPVNVRVDDFSADFEILVQIPKACGSD